MRNGELIPTATFVRPGKSIKVKLTTAKKIFNKNHQRKRWGEKCKDKHSQTPNRIGDDHLRSTATSKK